MSIRDILLTLLVVAIWGVNFVVIKLSVEALPPILAAALRFSFAAFPAILFVRPPKGAWRAVLGFGISFGFGLYSLLNLALFTGMPAGLASVVLQVQAFFTIVIAVFVFGDKPRWMQVLGGAIAFAGIGVIALQRWDGAALLPFVLTLFAALTWAIANVIAKKSSANVLELSVWAAVVSSLLLFGLSFLTEGFAPFVAVVTAPSPWTIGLVMFLAYPATLWGVATWNSMLRKYPTAVVAPFTLLVPITGLLSGWLVLGEQVTLLEMVGGALVVAGLGVTVFKPRNRPMRTGI